jgi:hypothetical protein
MDERVMFISDWLKDEESRAVLCRRYGISRKTGYQLAARYAREAEGAFQERSRAPQHQALAMAEGVEAAILDCAPAIRAGGRASCARGCVIGGRGSGGRRRARSGPCCIGTG